MNNLGTVRPTADLSFITKPGAVGRPEQAVIVESPDRPAKPDRDRKTEKPKKAESHEATDSAELTEKLTLLVSPELAERLYSEAFHDPLRRWMKDVIAEILEEALAKRPNKGPAPPQFIEGLKSRGKRKKS